MGIVTAACLVSVIASIAVPAKAQTPNGGFELNGGSLDNWATFNNVIPNVVATTTTPRSGTHVAKLFGSFDANPNFSGLFQSLSAYPGQVWEAGVHARHNTGDDLTATANQLVMKIEFYSVFGAEYGGPDFLQEDSLAILDAGSPLDTWTAHALQATAPAQTVEARIAFVFLQADYAAGAGLIDDVSFTPDSIPSGMEWSLIWQDEFDGPTIDTSKWRVEDLHLIKNNELQYYAPDDVYFEDGHLVLRSQQRTYCGYDEDAQWRCFNYTSGLVESKNLFATAYGRIEVRAQLPSTQGIWPAHWMMPSSGAWPPEIDITELLGHDPTRIHMTHHWGSWPDVQRHGGSFVGPNYSDDFHTFAVEWMPGRIDWLIDGQIRFNSTLTVPQEPFYIILNTAVGGDWPGNPDGSTVFPQFHRIDYVRAYVPADAGPALLEVVDPAPATADPDGAIDPGEYVASTTGINAGFGDRIGQNSLFYMNSGADGRINFAFHSLSPWPTTGPYGVVIFIDSLAGGFASTMELTDTADLGRRLVSGKGTSGQRADLYFAPGFRADYAISLQHDFAGIYELNSSSLNLINGADLGVETDILGGDEVCYRIDDGSFELKVREFEARLSHFGVQPGDSLAMVVTMLQGDIPYRFNEFVGVDLGNLWDGPNPGQMAAVLKFGDFIRFSSTPTLGDIDGDGDIDSDDISLFVDAVLGQPQDPVHLLRADLDGSGNADGGDVATFVDVVIGDT